MAVTLQQIAKEVGVSRPAVSAVLNNAKGKMGVSEAVRLQIIETAREMGYIPNLSAQMLHGKSSKAIGIYSGAVMQYSAGIRQNLLTYHASLSGYQVFMDIIDGPKDSLNVYRRISSILSRRVDGLILLDHLPPEVMRLVNVPYVVLGNEFSKITGQPTDIVRDRSIGGHMAGLHLAGHGHRKVIFLCSKLESNRGKFEGLQRAWDEAGLREEDCIALEAMKHEAAELEKIFLNLLKNNEFTSLLCGNDFVAGRCLGVLRHAGLRVPDDVALIGYDGAGFAYLTDPPLTTIIQNFDTEAETAIRVLLEKISGNQTASEKRETITVEPLFFQGGSCGCSCPPPALYAWSRDMPTLNERFPERITTYTDFLKNMEMKK